jgi:hypothetical protein
MTWINLKVIFFQILKDFFLPFFPHFALTSRKAEDRIQCAPCALHASCAPLRITLHPRTDVAQGAPSRPARRACPTERAAYMTDSIEYTSFNSSLPPSPTCPIEGGGFLACHYRRPPSLQSRLPPSPATPKLPKAAMTRIEAA